MSLVTCHSSFVTPPKAAEDKSRVRKINAAENLNTLKKFAVDFLRKDKTTNHTFKKKRRIMMWDDEMLQRIIIGK